MASSTAILIQAGTAAILAAVVGGGLKAFGVDVPIINNIYRQAALALSGLCLLGYGLWLEKNAKEADLQASFEETERDYVRQRTEDVHCQLRIYIGSTGICRGVQITPLNIELDGQNKKVASLSIVADGGSIVKSSDRIHVGEYLDANNELCGTLKGSVTAIALSKRDMESQNLIYETNQEYPEVSYVEVELIGLCVPNK